MKGKMSHTEIAETAEAKTSLWRRRRVFASLRRRVVGSKAFVEFIELSRYRVIEFIAFVGFIKSLAENAGAVESKSLRKNNLAN